MQPAPIPLREKPPAKVAPYHGTPFRFHSALRFALFPRSHYQLRKQPLCSAEAPQKTRLTVCRESLLRRVMIQVRQLWEKLLCATMSGCPTLFARLAKKGGKP